MPAARARTHHRMGREMTRNVDAREGYPHRAEVKTKAYRPGYGLPACTGYVVFCQDCADALLSIPHHPPGVLYQAEAAKDTIQDMETQAQAEKIAQNHARRFLRGA